MWTWKYFDRLRPWATRLSSFLGIQLLVQGIGALCGFLIVRTLTKQDYAAYTIAGTMLGLLSSLSDVGIANALLARGGQLWREKDALGRLVNAALNIRWQFFCGALLVSTGVFFLLNHTAETNLPQSVGLYPLVLASGMLQLTYTIWAVVLRLHRQIKKLQALDAISAILRLCLILTLIRTIRPVTAFAINAIAFGLQATLVRSWAQPYIQPAMAVNPIERKSLLALVYLQIPNAIFYCIYGQSSVVAISLFGKAHQVADVGALGRLGLFSVAFGATMSGLVLPAFARLSNDRDITLRYIQVIGLFLIGAILVTLIASQYPTQLLWLLGRQYVTLKDEVVWVVIANLTQSLSGLVWSMNAVRGWLVGAWLSVPAIIFCQLGFAFYLNLSTVRGAILFGALPEIAGILILIPVGLINFRRNQRGIAA